MKNITKPLFVVLSLFLVSGFVSNYFEISKNLEIFNNIYREINSYYVDPVDPGELMHSTIDTMLKRLDPYTKYIPESEIEDFRFQTTGEYGGIGATIRKIDEHVVIYQPYKNFPADKFGLQAGDVILEINEIKIIDSTVQAVSELLKGTPGTAVNVKIQRKNNQVQVFNIIREKIHVPSVPFSGLLDSNIGYVKLKRFTKNCAKEVGEAIDALSAKTKLNGLILDLRSNPGGLLNESINISNMFIEKNQTVVTTSGKNVEWDKNYVTKKEPKYPELPIIVLVNGASASASEIVAGAMQDLDRGVILGNKTYGKGLVQQSRKLNYNSRLKVTVAKYYTPSGRCIQDAVKTQDYNSYLEQTDETNAPDSLRNEFTTHAGRKVYDGGGIDPDIKIEPLDYPEVLWQLIRENYIFKFANLIDLEMIQQDSINKFILPESTYDEFVEYLEDQKFTFNINDEYIIDEIENNLQELTQEDLNLEQIYEAVEVLKKEISNKKQEDIKEHKVLINKYLNTHLIGRKFYESGRIEYELEDDPYILEALSILHDEEEYNQILTPSPNSKH